jgi:hypothetical protein
MIYSDGIHIISSESLLELHSFCLSIGIKPHWFHQGSKFEHYDIPKKMRRTFFKDNPSVKEVSSKEIVRTLKARIKP